MTALHIEPLGLHHNLIRETVRWHISATRSGLEQRFPLGRYRCGVSEAEEPLVGGRSTEGVVRIGDSVDRPSGAWTATVQAFLHHLRANGFTGAPEPRGFDERGREVLGFISGEVLTTPQSPDEPLVLAPYPAAWQSADALAAAGELIRLLHEAASGFATSHAAWRLCDRPMEEDKIICHGDLGPWNTVYVDGLPVAFIDWDSSGRSAPPRSRIRGLAFRPARRRR